MSEDEWEDVPTDEEEQLNQDSNRAGVTSTGVVDTPQGRRVLYHSPFEDPLGDYLEEHFGECSTVMSSPLLGVHVYVFPPCPQKQQDYWRMVTMGLSGHVMPTTEDTLGKERIELMCLSKDEPKIGYGPVGPDDYLRELLITYCDMVVTSNALFKNKDGLAGNMISGTVELRGLHHTNQRRNRCLKVLRCHMQCSGVPC